MPRLWMLEPLSAATVPPTVSEPKVIEADVGAVSVGAVALGASRLKVIGAEVPASVVGFTTVTLTLPYDTRSLAGTVAVSWREFT